LLHTANAAGDVDRGWRYLQNDDLGNAEREFAEALQRSPGLYPAGTGGAYVALARREYDRALSGFDAVLVAVPMYAPALVGRGQTLLALDRSAAALEALEAALMADPSLVNVRSRIDVKRRARRLPPGKGRRHERGTNERWVCRLTARSCTGNLACSIAQTGMWTRDSTGFDGRQILILTMRFR
jgi:tetratricopeptide (TPR) repeat protein